MMRVLSILLFILVLLGTSVNSTVLRKSSNRKHHAFIPHFSPIFKVPLSKVEPTDEQKAAFIDLVSNTHREVHNRWHKNHVMLQKTATTTNSVHTMKLGNFRNSQVSCRIFYNPYFHNSGWERYQLGTKRITLK